MQLCPKSKPGPHDGHLSCPLAVGTQKQLREGRFWEPLEGQEKVPEAGKRGGGLRFLELNLRHETQSQSFLRRTQKKF